MTTIFFGAATRGEGLGRCSNAHKSRNETGRVNGLVNGVRAAKGGDDLARVRFGRGHLEKRGRLTGKTMMIGHPGLFG